MCTYLYIYSIYVHIYIYIPYPHHKVVGVHMFIQIQKCCTFQVPGTKAIFHPVFTVTGITTVTAWAHHLETVVVRLLRVILGMVDDWRKPPHWITIHPESSRSAASSLRSGFGSVSRSIALSNWALLARRQKGDQRIINAYQGEGLKVHKKGWLWLLLIPSCNQTSQWEIHVL